MKATIYHLSDVLAVAQLQDRNETYVCECWHDGEEWRPLPQSLRKVQAISTADVAVADDPTSQDIVERTTLGIRRFRERLGQFSPEAARDAYITDLVHEAEGCKTDLDRFLAGVMQECRA